MFSVFGFTVGVLFSGLWLANYLYFADIQFQYTNSCCQVGGVVILASLTLRSMRLTNLHKMANVIEVKIIRI